MQRVYFMKSAVRALIDINKSEQLKIKIKNGKKENKNEQYSWLNSLSFGKHEWQEALKNVSHYKTKWSQILQISYG